MFFRSYYNSPIGKICLVSDDKNLIAVLLENQKNNLPISENDIVEDETAKVLIKTKEWLNRYFDKQNPKLSELQLAPIGNEFRQNVWRNLLKIPYGKTITYGEIAIEVAKTMGKDKMSAQAVGNAVGNNPIAIIIPCHRVIGKNGNLTGYAGGINKKIELLKLENVDMAKLFIPRAKKFDNV